MEPLFFSTPADFRKWLAENHDKSKELWLGYYKKATGKASLTWSESVDEALCYGWIDGLRKSIDDISYKIRFTPRKPKSFWSAVNLKKVNDLKALGLMKDPGLAAFEKRDEKRTETYAYEQKNVKLPTEFEDKIKANEKAWQFFEQLAPSYKRTSIWWVISAKREETRSKRLNILIQSSEEGLKIPSLRRKK